jgi:uncharacterized protein YraI
VKQKTILAYLTAFMLCTGCGDAATGSTATPDFFTATLPPQLVQSATQTPTLPAPPSGNTVEATDIPPIEGITTTQVNVRGGPSTASITLGMIGPFVKVQVIGKDASGSWYRIIYTETEAGKGWVRAEYVQVNAADAIPPVGIASASGSVLSGLTTQKINVRSGPGTEHGVIGVLNSNDTVFITGRDAGGAWIQIEFANSPDGKGWVTAQLLQVVNMESAPVIGGNVKVTPAPESPNPIPAPAGPSAVQDGDSMQAPSAVTVLSPAGSRALQIIGVVSAPGDPEDWIQFTTTGGAVLITLTCSGGTPQVNLWKDGNPVFGFSTACGNQTAATVMPNSIYFIRLVQDESGITNYILNVEIIG